MKMAQVRLGGSVSHKMETSDKLFRFGSNVQTSEGQSGDETVGLSVTSFGRDKNGTYVINNGGSLSNKAHEITHGGQIADGLVDLTAGSTLINYFATGIDASVLEHQAYRANYGISGDLDFGSAVSGVCGLDDPNFNNIVDQGRVLYKNNE